MRVLEVSIGGKKVRVAASSKADVARALLEAGHSVAAIAKAVPMSYSQAHSIAKSMGKKQNWKSAVPKQLDESRRKARAKVRVVRHAEKILAKQPSPRVGKLRTPGQPKDIAVGVCVNCGHTLAVRPLPTGFTLIHTNISAEEYIAEIQFCQAVPRSIVPI